MVVFSVQCMSNLVCVLYKFVSFEGKEGIDRWRNCDIILNWKKKLSFSFELATHGEFRGRYMYSNIAE